MCVPGKIILKSFATPVTTLTHMNNRSSCISAWNGLVKDIVEANRLDIFKSKL